MAISWREIQKQNFKNLKDLGIFLEIDLKDTSLFPLNIPKRLAEKMPKKTLDDPITRQFVPLPDPPKNPLGFCKDPVKDQSFCKKSDKLLQKYEGRALLLSTSACAMHCRYCFRQNYPYTHKSSFDEELSTIDQDKSLHEVILSGGDPLSLSDRNLKYLLLSLDRIPHIEIIRVHTRFPIGIPERIDQNFLTLLKSCKTQIVFVIHINHPREFDDDILQALKKLRLLGIPILVQTVLLKGVNDSVKTLKELYLHCIKSGIIPYYLHNLDQVEGASYFEVKQSTGLKLIQKLRSQLPGYALPRYVQEIPGKTEKTLIF